MAEIPPNVYDIIHPSPASLKELSAIAISLQIWRNEVNNCRKNHTLKEFCSSGERISLKTTLPDLPSMVFSMIGEYVRRFGLSMKKWLEEHYSAIFRYQYGHRNDILEDFDEFVCDFGGDIHYARTAKRMVSCDRFDMEEKFIIACTYFFEDDITRIWPFVPDTTGNAKFQINVQVCYWRSCLRNKLFEREKAETVYEKMFHDCRSWSLCESSMEYFWNRIPSENRMRLEFDRFAYTSKSFVKLILPKLSDMQVRELVNVHGYDLMNFLLTYYISSDEALIIPTWIRIRNTFNENSFTILVIEQLIRNNRNRIHKNWLYYYQEIWNSAPDHLKQSAIRAILSYGELFESWRFTQNDIYSNAFDYGHVKFFLTILPCATFEERCTFWHKCWHRLVGNVRGEDFQRIMKLCFRYEDGIAQFKENVVTKNENVRSFCVLLIRNLDLDKLNDFVQFCCPETQTARNFKQLLLQLSFFDEGSPFINLIKIMFFKDEFNEFINDAYGTADLSAEFRNKFMLSSPVIQHFVSQGVFNLMVEITIPPVTMIINFFDALAATEHALLHIKTRYIDCMKEQLTRCEFNIPLFDQFLFWCLGSDEEVIKFKRMYSVEYPRVEFGKS